MLVLVRSELLEQFVNTLTAYYQQCRQNRENLWQQVPRQLPGELNTFTRYFLAFPKSTLNLEYFEKKDHSQSLSITEIINRETDSYLNVRKAIFHATLLQITCSPFPNTAELSTEQDSYNSPINLR